MTARKGNESGLPPLGLPRNLLVPYVLMYLKNVSAHGYQILQTLTMLGFAAIDPATVYRTLRQMEKEGLVLSSWQTGDAGPARRAYTITDQGEQLLTQWADALGAYQRFLDRFFELFAGTRAAPAGSGVAAQPSDDGRSGPAAEATPAGHDSARKDSTE